MNDTCMLFIMIDHDMVLIRTGHSSVHVLLAITLPLVLFCVVLLTALVIFAVLVRLYSSRATKKGNPSVKTDKRSQGPGEPDATNEFETGYYTAVRNKQKHDLKATNEIDSEEVYYSTVKSVHDTGPNATNENEEAFYSTIIDLSTCAVDPQIVEMEKNSAYGSVKFTEKLTKATQRRVH